MASIKKSRSGQSLLELIIALGILTTSFLGVFALLSRSFFLEDVSTNETIASYLSAEGVEVVKSIVDNSVYSKRGWGEELNGSFVQTNVGGYAVTATSTVLMPATNKPLKFNPNTGLYQYTNGQATPFFRTITITTPNAWEIDVVSTVTWSTGPIAAETVTDEDHFYDWHP